MCRGFDSLPGHLIKGHLPGGYFYLNQLTIDDEQYPIPVAPPHEVIQFLMQDRGLRNRDLEPLLGSRGVTSEVIRGKRKPSNTQIRKLAEFFNVPSEAFLSLD
ncbi:MAG: hypothetical protein IPM55_18700 [Acidobacteria bacterium]|nr:hypothetical protein [Acidobacteriota bacterium]